MYITVKKYLMQNNELKKYFLACSFYVLLLLLKYYKVDFNLINKKNYGNRK